MPEDNQQKKKNNKKKNKKKDEEKVSEPELDLRSELDDGPWEEVKDTKKEKFIARQTKKKAAEAAKLAEERGEPAPSAPSEKKSESKKSEKKTKSEAGGKKQQSQQPKQQKKQPAKQPAVKKPSTEAELVAFIKQILEDTPQRYLHVPALGDRIQALTKLAWNKTFKPQHGSLKDFVSSRAEFIVDSVLERVSLKSHAQQQAAPTAKAPENKKAAKKEKKAAKQQRRQSEDDATEVQETSSNSTGLIAIGLFCVLLAGTAFVVLNKQ